MTPIFLERNETENMIQDLPEKEWRSWDNLQKDQTEDSGNSHDLDCVMSATNCINYRAAEFNHSDSNVELSATRFAQKKSKIDKKHRFIRLFTLCFNSN